MNQTEKQIQDFCKTAEHIAQYNRMPTLEVALQIIAQLQAELAIEQEKVKCQDDCADHIQDLLEQIEQLTEKNKRLRDEIRARRQWQTCPTCNRTFATDS